MVSRFTMVGLGEALFDIFPDAQILGGAPLNVAVHAHQLAQRHGGQGVVASRVGQDDLGRQVIDELTRRGMSAQYVQTDPDKHTGKVYVGLDERGQPSYDIVRDVAYDWLQFDPDWEDLAHRCEAVCFGSLAQRNAQARSAIQRFLTSAARAVRLFDVNLRQNYFDAQIIRRSCELATTVKLNSEELPVVAGLLGLSSAPAPGPGGRDVEAQARGVLKRFNLRLLVLTRGERGTVIYTPTSRHEGEPVRYDPVEGADAVGAGDACSAAILLGLALRWPLDKVVHLANHAGAYVASQPGATPALPEGMGE